MESLSLEEASGCTNREAVKSEGEKGTGRQRDGIEWEDAAKVFALSKSIFERPSLLQLSLSMKRSSSERKITFSQKYPVPRCGLAREIT